MVHFFSMNAIKLLEANEQGKFQNYLNRHEFNPHNLFVCKNLHSIETAFYAKIFDWLFKCEEVFKEL